MAIVMEIDDGVLSAKFAVILPHLDERQRRLLLAAEARSLGYGGVTLVARAAGVSRATVTTGVDELDSGADPLQAGRVRRSGGGRKALTETDPKLLDDLDALVKPVTRGDPMTRLRWTTASTRKLAEDLGRMGHKVSHHSVGRLLRGPLEYSLQANAKTIEGKQHPDRDGQFCYINTQVTAALSAGEPVISIDAKKKELIGPYASKGRTWRPVGDPERVDAHDFPGPAGKAVPYGIYDIAHDTGWVSVGCDGDTAQFAVATIHRWWNAVGQPAYPTATTLLITADAGGSNGYRLRLWKKELAALAQATGLTITVTHMPPGTSKWNKIEHRLFSHITMNWAGQPLTSHEVAVNLIAGTTTRTGLHVHAERDENTYPRGIKITDREMKTLLAQYVTPHDYHGEWNYTITPTNTPT
jgi:hypothetical protein